MQFLGEYRRRRSESAAELRTKGCEVLNISDEGYPKYSLKVTDDGGLKRTRLNKEEKREAVLAWRAKLSSRVDVRNLDLFELSAKIAPHVKIDAEQSISDAAWAATVVRNRLYVWNRVC